MTNLVRRLRATIVMPEPSGGDDTGAFQLAINATVLQAEAADEIERLQRRESEARALLEPLADCDPAVRAWLKG